MDKNTDKAQQTVHKLLKNLRENKPDKIFKLTYPQIMNFTQDESKREIFKKQQQQQPQSSKMK